MLTRQIERNFKLLTEARELGWSLGRMLEKPPYFLPAFSAEDHAPDPEHPDDDAPDAAETAPASPAIVMLRAEDTPPHASETGEPASTLEPIANHAGTVAPLSEAQDEARADDVPSPPCADDPSLDSIDDRLTQHPDLMPHAPPPPLAGATGGRLTPVPDHVTWLPGNLHQIDPITGVMRFRSERPAH